MMLFLPPLRRPLRFELIEKISGLCDDKGLAAGLRKDGPHEEFVIERDQVIARSQRRCQNRRVVFRNNLGSSHYIALAGIRENGDARDPQQ